MAAGHAHRAEVQPCQPGIGDAHLILEVGAGRRREQHAADAAGIDLVAAGQRHVVDLPALDPGVVERRAGGVIRHLLEPRVADHGGGGVDRHPHHIHIHLALPSGDQAAKRFMIRQKIYWVNVLTY